MAKKKRKAGSKPKQKTKLKPRRNAPRPKYRDGLFRDYFNEPMRALSLCNALLQADATDPKEVEINTLDGIFFSQAKNDLSCLFRGCFMVVMEQQSTRNENMPLRMLFYATDLLRQWIAPIKDRIYQTKLIHLPKFRIFVLYNGDAQEEERRTLRLSDAFGNDKTLELTVELININAGQNEELIHRCRYLQDYCAFVNRVKGNVGSGMKQKDAIKEAIDYCCSHDIMAEYLKKKSKEVFDMVSFEWNLDDAKRAWREEALEEGREEGRAEGREKGREEGREEGREQGRLDANLTTLRNLMANGSLTATNAMELMGIPSENRDAYLAML